jgi:hypothetical protein
MSEKTEKTEMSEKGPFYVCPKGCAENFFYQTGSIGTLRVMDENGKVIKDNFSEFAPSNDPVKCRNCDSEAIVKTKTTKTTITIS